MTDEKNSNGNIFDFKKSKPRPATALIEWRKFTKVGITLIILIVLLIIALLNIFIVKEGEYRVVRQFGEVVKIVDKPGLNAKIPFIQSVTTLPKHQLTYDVSEAEINTRDKKRIIIDNYAVWRITSPKDMISNAGTLVNAESRMEEYIYSVVRTELGQLNYDEIINDEKSSRGSLNDRVTDRVNEFLAQESFGIEVVDVRMKQTDLPTENEQSVFTRMISERQSKAQEYLSTGDANKNRIEAQTDREVRELLAKANAEADTVRAEGEAEAAQLYNESFSKDPEFYELYRTLESYKSTINDKTMIILPSDSPYASLLQGVLE